MYSYGPPHMAVQKQDDQHEHTFSSYVRIRDVVLKTYLGRWTIGGSGERGPGISVLPAQYDDDECSRGTRLNCTKVLQILELEPHHRIQFNGIRRILIFMVLHICRNCFIDFDYSRNLLLKYFWRFWFF